MRNQAQVLAMKFFYGMNVRRKLDRIRSRYGRDNTYFLAWYHRENPIVISVQCRFGQFLKLDSGPKMTKPIMDRFNELFSRYAQPYKIVQVGRGSWRIIRTQIGQVADAPWLGQLVLRITLPPKDEEHKTINERMDQILYGTTRHSTA